MTTHIIPAVDDPLSSPFWSALREARLMFQQCNLCGYQRFPAAERCPECWSPEGTWVDVAPAGTIWSHTTYHRALHPRLADAVPYSVILVELDSGPTIPGRWLGADQPRIGARVSGVFTEVTAEFSMLDWGPA